MKKTGHPVSVTIPYCDMENYEKSDRFLKDCENGRSGSAVIYEIRRDGGINRKKFLFDGEEMYVVSTSGDWLENDTPGIAYTTCMQIKEWEYTENGWFCYELCVPEPPEVTEIIDGSCLIRIVPMPEKERELTKRCVQEIGYHGNNL